MTKRKSRNNNNNNQNNKRPKRKNNNRKARDLAGIQAQIRLAIARGNQATIKLLKRMYLALAA
jgi:hypothetical protein